MKVTTEILLSFLSKQTANLDSSREARYAWGLQAVGGMRTEGTSDNEIGAASVFPLASLSKHFLAAAILDLARVGKIDLSQDIRDYFPNFYSVQPITLEHLLTQTSGIREYLMVPTEMELNSWSLVEYCDFIGSLPLQKTGEYMYSNSNYVLLSLVLEIISGTSYDNYLTEKFFQPLKMFNTFCFEQILRNVPRLAAPMNVYSPETKLETLNRANFGWGDSAIFSCIKDFSIWLNSSVFLDYIHQLQALFAKRHTKYHAGLLWASIDGKTVYYHSGSTIGASSAFVFIPADEAGAVILANDGISSLVPGFLNLFQIDTDLI